MPAPKSKIRVEALLISKGKSEQGVVYGNAYDKYNAGNPIARHLVSRFKRSVSGLVQQVNPSSVHEVGCGEGFWTLKLIAEGYPVTGSDFSSEVIEIASQNAASAGVDTSVFRTRSVYDLDPKHDSADLVLCTEVLEHLEEPQQALEKLTSIANRYVILSVPREPIWRAMNLARGAYVKNLGNTPGHIQHWSKRQFLNLVGHYCKPIEILTPLPWTVLLCQTDT